MESTRGRLARLYEIGFEPVGEWKLITGSLKFNLHKHEQEKNILYAFVNKEVVLYIGKSTGSLFNRMYQYLHPGPTQWTNIKNNQNIIEALQDEEFISICAFVQKEPLLYKGVSLNLSAGLEDPLIAIFSPPWNKIGKNKIVTGEGSDI